MINVKVAGSTFKIYDDVDPDIPEYVFRLTDEALYVNDTPIIDYKTEGGFKKVARLMINHNISIPLLWRNDISRATKILGMVNIPDEILSKTYSVYVFVMYS